jgi:hypothetical protein
VFWDVLSRFTFDANLLCIFNLGRVHNIENPVITTALVALDSIGVFNPCNSIVRMECKAYSIIKAGCTMTCRRQYQGLVIE